MQQARAAPGSASRRTHHAQKRGSLSKGCVSRAAHQTPLTSRKRPVNPGGNHIRANMVHASLVAGPLIIHVGRLPGERATPNPRRRWAEKALHPTHPRWGRLSTAAVRVPRGPPNAAHFKKATGKPRREPHTREHGPRVARGRTAHHPRRPPAWRASNAQSTEALGRESSAPNAPALGPTLHSRAAPTQALEHTRLVPAEPPPSPGR